MSQWCWADRYAKDRFDPWHDEHQGDVTLREAKRRYLRAHRGQAPTTLKNKKSLLRRFCEHLGQSKCVHIAEEHMAGWPGEARIRALEWLCPGADPEMIRRVAGGGETWRSGRLEPFAQSGSVGQIEEVLFSGWLYREDVRQGT